MKALFHTLLFQPLHGALIFLAQNLPGHSLALAIILLTIIVKLVLFPLQQKISRTQHLLRILDPQIRALKEKFAKDNAAQAKEMMALYRKYKINPLTGFVVLLIQIPILLALFFVFRDSFVANTDLSMTLFGFFDMRERSIVLAVLTGLTQFFQAWLLLPAPVSPPAMGLAGQKTFQADFQRGLHLQMRYFLPVMIGFIAAGLPAAISLYWITSNLFTIGQELWFRRRFKALVVE